MAPACDDPFALGGTSLAGKYDVLNAIEETEFSVVYRAYHRVWRRPVAIKAFKVPTLGERSREQLLDSFVREGALLMELSERCAAICQARDIGSTTTTRGDWVLYMVLEWLEGESLETTLSRERATGRKPRSVEQAIALLAPVAHALSLAHERGIVHCDLKPGNVFVLANANSDAGGCKLLDFGVAKVVGDARAENRDFFLPPFTAAYAAPEQFGQEYGTTGPWTDVFALALVFVELVIGREALQGDTVSELTRRACDPRERPTPIALGGRVPLAVERVLRRALAVRPADRFADARAFWSALTCASAEMRFPATIDSTMTIPIPLLRRRAPSPRRRWIVPAAALIGAAVTLVALQQQGTWSAVAWAKTRSRALIQAGLDTVPVTRAHLLRR